MGIERGSTGRGGPECLRTRGLLLVPCAEFSHNSHKAGELHNAWNLLWHQTLGPSKPVLLPTWAGRGVPRPLAAIRHLLKFWNAQQLLAAPPPSFLVSPQPLLSPPLSLSPPTWTSYFRESATGKRILSRARNACRGMPLPFQEQLTDVWLSDGSSLWGWDRGGGGQQQAPF